MRKFAIAFFILTLMLGSIPLTAYATDCTQDTLLDRFGDWFGNVGKKEKSKNRNIAARKANRLAACAEKEAQEAAAAVQKPGDEVKN
ncbi:MAG: hypothetical protein V1673_02720 [Candidatus Omnitrophota bacterium]